MATALLTQHSSLPQLHLVGPPACASSFQLLNLPLEILLHNLAPCLETQTLSHLTRTCKILHSLLEFSLLRRARTHHVNLHTENPALWLTKATVLQYAVLHYQQPLLAYLLKSFPDLINQRCDIGLTPLQLCVIVNVKEVEAQHSKEETIRKILVAGADARGTWGPSYTPLHWASQDGCKDAFKVWSGCLGKRWIWHYANRVGMAE